MFFKSRRGEQQEVVYLDESRVMLKYLLPLNEVIVDFYDELKTQSSGYARFVVDFNKFLSILSSLMVVMIGKFSKQDDSLKTGSQAVMALPPVFARPFFVPSF